MTLRVALAGLAATLTLTSCTTSDDPAATPTPTNAPAIPAANTPYVDANPATPVTVTVTRIIDGDTVELADGQRLRLIGVNTPEIGRNGTPDDCYAREAVDELAGLIPADGTITITFDTEPRDRYERLLAWVWVDDQSINAALVARGAATVMLIPPNTAHADLVTNAEQHARTQRAGMWNHC